MSVMKKMILFLLLFSVVYIDVAKPMLDYDDDDFAYYDSDDEFDETELDIQSDRRVARKGIRGWLVRNVPWRVLNKVAGALMFFGFIIGSGSEESCFRPDWDTPCPNKVLAFCARGVTSAHPECRECSLDDGKEGGVCKACADMIYACLNRLIPAMCSSESPND